VVLLCLAIYYSVYCISVVSLFDTLRILRPLILPEISSTSGMTWRMSCINFGVLKIGKAR